MSKIPNVGFRGAIPVGRSGGNESNRAVARGSQARIYDSSQPEYNILINACEEYSVLFMG